MREATGQALPDLSHEIEVVPPFFDIDSMDIVWHGHYAKYFELARCALLDKFGYVDRDKDGWRELPDGKPFTVVMASTPSGRDRERDELWKKNMTAHGGRNDCLKQEWPDLLGMCRPGTRQAEPLARVHT